MAADKKRANLYKKQIADLMAGLSFKEGLARFESKMLALLARGEIDYETERGMIKQVARIFNPEFVQYHDRVIKKYDDLTTLVNYHYKEIGEEIGRHYERIQAIEKVANTRFGALNKKTTKKITRFTRKLLLTGADHQAVAKVFKKKTALAGYHAETLGRTTVKGYGAALKMEKSRIGNVVYFEYVGIVRANTRAFCLERLNKTYHIDEIRQMDNGQINPVWIYRGGYNCHHDWEPDPFFKSNPSGSRSGRA